ncbi:hypothetical protein CDG81_17665 [Actinopolyspora erythraea]|uniref:Uncharacterized protein n=1 Tax=Actinopolyspora erythraea TaxID=414996 RepID=A0A223RV96_9ACTN|nr:hypothetical protein [Actinopolyspora erythraea]ASU79785.1 hypothetical protein CDG81_17665 [Actinopolyspora erythraea]
MQPPPQGPGEGTDERSHQAHHPEVDGHLVAAVHLKPELADRLIDNYTSAPREALPPPQGTDAVNVLTQALTARRKRRIRDVLLLVLTSLAGLTLFPYTVMFVLGLAALWLFWSLTFGARRQLLGIAPKARADEEEPHPLGILITCVFLGGAFVVLSFATRLSTSLSSERSTYYSEPDAFPRPSAGTALLTPVLLFVLCLVAILAVLLLDKWVTRHLVASHGGRIPRRTNLLVAGTANSLVNSVRRRYGELLAAVAQRGDGRTVLAHAGWDAFVGYGEKVNAWTLPLVLRTRSEEADPPVLHPREVYSAVTEELRSMWDSDLLAPGRRLRGLTVGPLVVVNTRGLRENRNTHTARTLLSSETGQPVDRTDAETLNQLIDEDFEWVRHFQHSSVMSWNSDQLISTMFNIGCDNRTLYLEWNAYCLYPMAQRYRLAGFLRPSGKQVVAATLLEFLQLLGSLAWRAKNLNRATDPATGRSFPGRDRNVRSIRELVAEEHCANEFQDLDGQRHMTLLEERTLSAVRNHLSERGFDTEGLEQHTTQIISNTSNSFNNSQFLGPQNFGEGGSAVSAPPRHTPSGGVRKESD